MRTLIIFLAAYMFPYLGLPYPWGPLLILIGCAALLAMWQDYLEVREKSLRIRKLKGKE